MKLIIETIECTIIIIFMNESIWNTGKSQKPLEFDKEILKLR